MHPEIPLIVGVTSHRDLREAQVGRLREQMRVQLQRLQAAFPDIRLTILSPLAEGGDQLVAEEGLRLGARLVVPLPLPLDLYLRDFQGEEARARFLRLLERGEALSLPVPGDVAPASLCRPGPARDLQYARCGLYVADHCHVLLALWDGRPPARLGGTAQVVSYYLGASMPGVRDARTRIRQVLANDDDSLVLHMPVGRRGHPGPGNGDREPAMDACRWLTSSGECPASQPMPPAFVVIFERLQAFARDLARHPDRAPEREHPSLAAWLHRRADRLALHFQARMLFAMRATYALAALMAIALMVYPDSPRPQLVLWLFLLLFATGLALNVVAHRREWHRKYIDYRALAEGLRVQAFWRQAGIAATGDEQFAHENFLQKQDVDLGWIRNAMRHASLQEVPPAGPDDVERACEQWIGQPGGDGQLDWYARKAAQREREHLRTRMIGGVSLWTGIAICTFLALAYRQLPPGIRDALALVVGALSVAAAVRAAYAFRKADRELVKQYRFMHRIYDNARRALDATQDWREKQQILRSLGEAALSEHAEWALMHRERPLEHGRL